MPQSIGELFLAEQQASAEAAVDQPAASAPSSEPTKETKETPVAEPETPPDDAATSTAEPEAEPKPEPTPAETPPAPPRTLKVKIDGEEVEIDEEEAARGYQLKKVSQAKIQEAVERTRDANWTMQQVVEKPAEAFIQLAGRKLPGGEEEARQKWDEMCVARVREMIQEEGLSEEQRAILQERRKLEKEKREITAHKERQRQEVQARLDKQADERLQADFQAALKKHGLPDHSLIRRLTADKLLQALDSGIEMTADEAVYESGKEWREWVKQPPATKTPQAPPRKEATEFPSTPSGEGALPPKAGTQRTRQQRFDSIRKFHEHIAGSV